MRMNLRTCTRCLGALLGVVLAFAVVDAQQTQAECVSDPPVFCSATVIGHGCNTINNPPHPTYRDCCQYWTWKCTGSSQTWKERMLTNGESCTNMGSPEDPLYHCPTAPSQPPTD